jgi:DNA-directed RNA polymerase subunit RPC12/RpoP
MYKCPHCGKPGISVWSKLTIGLYNPTICKQCGNKVGLPNYSWFIMVPFIIATFLTTIYIDDFITLKIAFCVVETFILGVIYLKFVPLVPK